ncbi:hypothetical protein ACP3TJ_12630, partial [Desulforudis sp. 1088]
KASGTVLSEGEVSVAADEDVRGRFRCQSVGRTLALGLACANLYVLRNMLVRLGRRPNSPALNFADRLSEPITYD